MDRIARIFAAVALVGAVGWLLKVALIWNNGGTNLDEGIVGIMYLVGAVGLLVGSAFVGLWIAHGRATWIRALAAVGGIAAFVASYTLISTLATATVGDAGPAWLEDEAEIIATALVWGVLATAALKRSAASPSVTSDD